MRGLVPAVAPVIDQLRGMGMYLSDRFVEQVEEQQANDGMGYRLVRAVVS